MSDEWGAEEDIGDFNTQDAYATDEGDEDAAI
jgi:hypothetical protein